MVSNVRLTVVLALLPAVLCSLPLQDVTATVNHLFTYSIDPSDFPGEEITVKEAGKDVLPSWLEYDRLTNILVGIPSAKDKGTCILKVGKEMFALSVTEPTKSQIAQLTNSDEQTICKPHDSITVVYVKLNADADTMPGPEKSRLVRSLSAHLSLKPDHISMSTRPIDLVDSSHALVSGNGDMLPSEDSLSTLSWIVGCGAVKSRHMDILEKLESTAKDGTLGRLLATPVSGWQVQSNQPRTVSKRRLKRQLVTATPTPATVTVEESTPSTTQQPTPTAIVSMTVPKETTTTLRPANQKPVLHESMLVNQLSANGGELVKWTIPDGLFTDPEGERLTYTVSSALGKKEWIVRDNQELVGLADKSLEFGSENIVLTATDASGASTTTSIKVKHGEYHQEQVTQSYTINVRLTETLGQPSGSVYLALTLQERLGLQGILVQSIEKDINTKLITVTIGDNTGRLTNCPRTENRDKLMLLRELVRSQVPLVGMDEGSMYITEIDSVKSVDPCANAQPEVNREKIGQYKPLIVNLGELYESTIPVDLFTDEEDGDLSQMSIALLVDGKVKADGWISINPKNRQLQALTWDAPNSQSQFTLTVKDSVQTQVDEAIEVQVVDDSDNVPPTNLFTLTIDEKYSVFANSHKSQVELYKKISQSFPDSVVTIKSVKQGSVVAQFSLRQPSPSPKDFDECPEERVESYKSAVFDGDEVKDSFIKQHSPYTLKQVDFAPLGACENVVEPKSATIIGSVAIEEEEKPKSNILPIIIAVVVVLVVLILIVVIVLCVRKRKAAKANTSRQNGGDIEKRVPAVMDEEMKSLTKAEDEPLMTSAEVSYKPNPPAYPMEDDYQPDTPPVSEPDDEQRIIDRSP